MIRRNQEEPMCEQIYHELRNEIKNGKLQAGEKLISERQLAAILGVSRSTTREAYRRLQEEYIISKSPKKGSYVVNSKE